MFSGNVIRYICIVSIGILGTEQVPPLPPNCGAAVSQTDQALCCTNLIDRTTCLMYAFCGWAGPPPPVTIPTFSTPEVSVTPLPIAPMPPVVPQPTSPPTPMIAPAQNPTAPLPTAPTAPSPTVPMTPFPAAPMAAPAQATVQPAPMQDPWANGGGEWEQFGPEDEFDDFDSQLRLQRAMVKAERDALFKRRLGAKRNHGMHGIRGTHGIHASHRRHKHELDGPHHGSHHRHHYRSRRRSFLERSAAEEEQFPVPMSSTGSCSAWTTFSSCGEWVDEEQIPLYESGWEIVCSSDADMIVRPVVPMTAGKMKTNHVTSTHALPFLPPAYVYVFAGAVTRRGGHPVVPVVSAITPSSFNLQLEEPKCVDKKGKHKMEEVAFLAVLQSAAANSDHFLLGEITLNLSDGWEAMINFPPGLDGNFFRRKPVVLTQLQYDTSVTADEYSIVRLSDVDQAGFKVRLQNPEKANRNRKFQATANAQTMKIAWIAFRQTDGVETLMMNDGKHQFSVKRFNRDDKTLRKKIRGGNQKWRSYKHGGNFPNPLIFGNVLSEHGTSPCDLRMKKKNNKHVKFKLEEPKKKCKNDGRHKKEDIGVVVIQSVPNLR